MSDSSEANGYREGYAAAIEVLDGRRTSATNDGEAKLLKFMLDDRSECDLEITPRQFIIRYSWHPSNHPYYPELAAGVVAQLMSWAQLPSVGQHHVGPFGPGDSGAGAYHCSFDQRWIWFLREDDAIKIAIRFEVPGSATAFRMPEPITR